MIVAASMSIFSIRLRCYASSGSAGKCGRRLPSLEVGRLGFLEAQKVIIRTLFGYDQRCHRCVDHFTIYLPPSPSSRNFASSSPAPSAVLLCSS